MSARGGARVACRAMATRFEIVIRDMDPAAARAAGEEAIAEILNIEEQLSWFRPQSLLNRINRQASLEAVPVHAPVFDLLTHCRQLHEETGAAFDPTVRPDDWEGKPPGLDGMDLDALSRTVRFTRPGLALNLGAIGKGYALDEAAALLTDAGVENALLHGGTSTVIALGRDGTEDWRVALSRPEPHRAGEVLSTITLSNAALSASSIYGRGRSSETGWEGHVIDPRTAEAVRATELAATVVYSSEVGSAARADALSTALLVLGSRSAQPSTFANSATLCYSNTRITEMEGPWEAPPAKPD